jgi:hypothetical protein
MPAPRWGRTLVSGWVVRTFSAEAVRGIANEAYPGHALVADPDKLADTMNSAADHLLLSLKASSKTSDAEAWADGIIEACTALITACGHPPLRAALRLGLAPKDVSRFGEMLETANGVRSVARRYADDAAAAKAKATPARPPAENVWLGRMAEIFEAGFNRKAGITKNMDGQRGGPCSRFIAGAANRLAADASIKDAPPAWAQALQRFSAPKTVASRLASIRATASRVSQ